MLKQILYALVYLGVFIFFVGLLVHLKIVVIVGAVMTIPSIAGYFLAERWEKKAEIRRLLKKRDFA